VPHRFAWLLTAVSLCLPALAADDAARPRAMSTGDFAALLSTVPPRIQAPGALPAPIALAATWDRALVHEAYRAAAQSLRMQGVHAVLGPSLEVGRDPRRGQPEQTFGEDPYLVAEMGVAAIMELQSSGEAPLAVAATGFVGPALPRDGAGTSPMSERELRQVYAAPYAQAIARADVIAIVPARNEMGGIPSHANARLLKDLLRGEMHFRGLVVADPAGIADLASVYHVAANGEDAARLAKAAGVDVIPRDGGAPTIAVEVPDAIALAAATRSITLLKNDGGALPLAASRGALPRVAVVTLGNAYEIAKAIRDQATGRADVVDIEAGPDRIVVIAGSDAPADRLREIVAQAPQRPVIVVAAGDRPELDAEVADQASAVLAAWALGNAGPRAVAAVLFGDANPGGKLPVTLARSMGQLPLFHDAKPSSRRGYLFGPSEPLFPFGGGLSYTTFEIGAPRLSAPQVDAASSVTVSVDVRNTGARAGDETIQLYAREKVSPVARGAQQLAGFERVTLAPGESRTVSLPLSAPALALWDASMQRVVEPGEYEVMTGPDSAHLQSAPLTIVSRGAR
jgi:beta-glucosidase-like glycosyl hydrolase